MSDFFSVMIYHMWEKSAFTELYCCAIFSFINCRLKCRIPSLSNPNDTGSAFRSAFTAFLPISQYPDRKYRENHRNAHNQSEDFRLA